jgi:NAD-dependent dihydropyrimidine dehydrogenase PreA subunit
MTKVWLETRFAGTALAEGQQDHGDREGVGYEHGSERTRGENNGRGDEQAKAETAGGQGNRHLRLPRSSSGSTPGTMPGAAPAAPDRFHGVHGDTCVHCNLCVTRNPQGEEHPDGGEPDLLHPRRGQRARRRRP